MHWIYYVGSSLRKTKKEDWKGRRSNYCRLKRKQRPRNCRSVNNTTSYGAKRCVPRHNGGRLTELDILKANLEEERTHLIEQVSALQAVQLGHEKAIEKAGRDKEEHTTIIVCDVPMQRMVLTIL